MTHATPHPARPAAVSGLHLVTTLLSIFLLVGLVLPMLVSLNAEHERMLHTMDNAICYAFLIEFTIRAIRATDKRAFWKWGWIDLLSSIPQISWLRWGRLFSIVRFFQVLRGLKSARALGHSLFQSKTHGTLTVASALSAMVVIASAILILRFERVPGGNIKTSDDALWWAITTITTVGYGDRYPVTPARGIVGSILMLVGISLFATVTASIASLLNRNEGATAARVEELTTEIRALRTMLEKSRHGPGDHA